MLNTELQVINMAKAWKRARGTQKRHFRKMLVLAVESLEHQETLMRQRKKI